jgi:4-amino-4-deoxy-L-arabinose transferase-like glycosyltransferase
VLTAIKVGIIGLIAGAVYLSGLEHSPVYLAHDEVLFGLQAHAVAETGRDINGNFLPLYFVEPGYSIGRDPLHVYLSALVLKAWPLSAWSIRAAAALVGVVNIMLMFLVARRVVTPEWLAWAAAAILALTPVHFMHSRLGISVIYPVPFVIGWLLCVVIYLQQPQLRWLFAAGLALGCGIYSYLAALVMIPVYWLASIVALWPRRSMRAIVVVTAGFALPLSLLAWWHLAHPERYRDIVNSYRLYDANRLSPLQGLRDLTSYFSLGERTAVYWQAFNPGRWFFTGDSSLVKSTRLVGLFLMPVAPLLLSGLLTVAKRRTTFDLLLVAGLLTAPLPEVLAIKDDIGRWLVVVPFVVLIATIGAETMWVSGRRGRRIAAMLLLVAMVPQFVLFYRDYTTDYRIRSGHWFGGGDTRTAVSEALRLAPEVAFLSDSVLHLEAYWRFYALINGARAAAIPTSRVGVKETPVTDPATRAAYITPLLDDGWSAVLEREGWRIAARVKNLDGEVAFLVWSHGPLELRPLQ